MCPVSSAHTHLATTTLVAVAIGLTSACKEPVESPVGTWKGSDNNGGAVTVWLRDDDRFFIRQDSDAQDARGYLVAGVYHWTLDGMGTISEQAYASGFIEFIVQEIEQDGAAVQELELNPTLSPAGSGPTLSPNMPARGFWFGHGDQSNADLIVSTGCDTYPPVPTGELILEYGECWNFDTRGAWFLPEPHRPPMPP